MCLGTRQEEFYGDHPPLASPTPCTATDGAAVSSFIILVFIFKLGFQGSPESTQLCGQPMTAQKLHLNTLSQ